MAQSSPLPPLLAKPLPSPNASGTLPPSRSLPTDSPQVRTLPQHGGPSALIL